MPYCESGIKIEAQAIVSEVLSAFAKEHCNAHQTQPLDGRQFSIDHGLNDLRAIQQVDESIYGFFCRYASDLQKTQAKIQAFAKDHTVECKLVDIEDVRKLRHEESYYE